VNPKAAVSEAEFEAKYRQSADPWQFAASPYEQRRYATTLRALTKARYARAFEPGCSVGVLTAALAQRCNHLLASDIAPTAIRLARERCAGLSQVSIEQADIGAGVPQGPFELIVFSELGYYFKPNALASIAHSLGKALAPSGELIAVHWRGESADHVLHGDRVHSILKDSLSEHCMWLKGERHPEFMLDVWCRA
jgi:protein-L-isoaspartate O-methyltransferase